MPSPDGYNCVQFVKKKRPDIGTGYGSLVEKLSKATIKEPKRGLIGITPEGWSGHLVYVLEVKEKTIIVEESNYKRGFITKREIPKSLVIGYL